YFGGLDMFHKRKKAITALLSLFVSFSVLCTAFALPEKIHDQRTVQTITKGVTYENIKRFTVDGWLSINVIRVDLSDPHLVVDTMSNGESLQKLKQTKAMAQENKAVAAVNGGFFIWSNDPGLIIPIGPSMTAGSLNTAYTDFNTN